MVFKYIENELCNPFRTNENTKKYIYESSMLSIPIFLKTKTDIVSKHNPNKLCFTPILITSFLLYFLSSEKRSTASCTFRVKTGTNNDTVDVTKSAVP